MLSVMLPFAFSLGYPELIVIAIVALLVFGKRLPEVARSLGRGVTEFKKGLKGVEDEASAPVGEEKKEALEQSPPETESQKVASEAKEEK